MVAASVFFVVIKSGFTLYEITRTAFRLDIYLTDIFTNNTHRQQYHSAYKPYGHEQRRPSLYRISTEILDEGINYHGKRDNNEHQAEVSYKAQRPCRERRYAVDGKTYHLAQRIF